MAERLTNRTHDGNAYLVNVKDDEQEVECKSINTAQCILDSWECLAAYEDLGPVEEFAALKERTRWIPVSERLPKINGAYQVFRPTFHNPMCFSICYFDGQNTWHDSYGVDFTRVLSSGDVTHWMPLPEAPKEEDHAAG